MSKPYRVEIVGGGFPYVIVFDDGADKHRVGRDYPLPGLPEEICRDLNDAYARGRRAAPGEPVRAAPSDEWPFRAHRTLADIDRDAKAVAP